MAFSHGVTLLAVALRAVALAILRWRGRRRRDTKAEVDNLIPFRTREQGLDPKNVTLPQLMFLTPSFSD
jgi:hypothetical protein